MSGPTAPKTLLISVNRCATPDLVFPLGLAHLNAALRRAGHVTRWLDLLADPDPLETVLQEFQPDFVGVSLRNIDDVLIRKRATFYPDLVAVCETVRQHHPCPVILGGSGFSIFPKPLLEQSGADYGIQGNGEAALVALLEALKSGRPVGDIPGLVYRRNGGIQVNTPQPATVADGLEIEDFPPRLVGFYLQKGSMLNVQTQRGCPFRCAYCTYPLIEGRTTRARPPEKVADDLERAQRLGARYVFLVDSVFNTSAAHAAAVCEAVVKRSLTLKWGCFLRPQGLSDDLLALMARAGLAHAEFGSDSLCDSVLEAYGKGFTVGDIVASSERARRAGIDYCHFLIAGGTGETLETLEDAFRNSLRLPDPVILAAVGVRMYPGTALAERAMRDGTLQPGQDLLAPVYYLAPGLTEPVVFERLHEFTRRSARWVTGDPDPAYTRMVERLRQRGVAGPLWSYISTMQRLIQLSPPRITSS